MRILRVIASMDPVSGGPCEGIRNSIPAMEQMGALNEVASLDDPDAAYIKEAPFKIYAFGPAKGPYAYCAGLSVWLEKNLGMYDVVIIHGLWLYNSYATLRVWRKLKIKGQKMPVLYVMPHGMLDPYFQKSRQRLFKAVRNWIFWTLIERKVVNGADGLLFTCQKELLLARDTFKPYCPKAEFNVGYGIKSPPLKEDRFLEGFLKACPQVKGSAFWLYLSRIHPKKGVDNLIKAYVKLKDEDGSIPDLVIAGPGLESSFGKNLLKLAKGYPVHFPGMLNGSAKWGAFMHADAFVLPSHQENFGIAVVEALACGKPVLISNKVNIYKEIEIEEAGLIKNDNLSETFSLLKEYHELAPEEKMLMGENAKILFLKKYRIKEAAKQMLQVLERQIKTVENIPAL
ncbi:glycosyltransferase [Salinimicrobium sp. TH3]|uniref:glycosyltransferase n=1 Tax=Salinimicrobium sp. TH3 TaxID=2997342 RepID=UPI002272F174|nr:glycosyltransferase [Salinimicrobium sp. TH3]MCY2687944.1 glycosyltransferase [Salinimicrobium sp. TH3]